MPNYPNSKAKSKRLLLALEGNCKRPFTLQETLQFTLTLFQSLGFSDRDPCHLVALQKKGGSGSIEKCHEEIDVNPPHVVPFQFTPPTNASFLGPSSVPPRPEAKSLDQHPKPRREAKAAHHADRAESFPQRDLRATQRGARRGIRGAIREGGGGMGMGESRLDLS